MARTKVSYSRVDSLFRALFLTVVVAVLMIVVWRGSLSPPVMLPRTLVLYCFSIMDETMNDGILPAFKEVWRERTGEDVEFITSYAGSGTITQKIIRKFPAEVAILSSELDVLRLSGTGIYANRASFPFKGVVTRSPIVIYVRQGNPKGIQGFSDLTESEIQLVHSDPLTSGGGEWSILSFYGSMWRGMKDRDFSSRQLRRMWGNVVEKMPSAREARERFEGGSEDALITYEKDVLQTSAEGARFGEIVYPAETLMSEHLVVKIEKNIDPAQQDLVDAFVQFLWSREAQTIFVKNGFRSVREELNTLNSLLGNPKEVFTLQDLGGARETKQIIIESAWMREALRSQVK